MNTTLLPAPLLWRFRDHDVNAARARFEALHDALARRGISVHLGECDAQEGHVIALAVGGRDGVLFFAVRMVNGGYEGSARGTPPGWLLAHVERAWAEVS